MHLLKGSMSVQLSHWLIRVLGNTYSKVTVMNSSHSESHFNIAKTILLQIQWNIKTIHCLSESFLLLRHICFNSKSVFFEMHLYICTELKFKYYSKVSELTNFILDFWDNVTYCLKFSSDVASATKLLVSKSQKISTYASKKKNKVSAQLLVILKGQGTAAKIIRGW